jgi:hypothetical protein
MSPRPVPGSPFNGLRVPAVVETYSVGDRVSHDSFGLGTVTIVEPELAVTVDFGTMTQRVVSPFAKLSKL